MSRKISNVNLKAFRAYESEKNFDFSINNEEIANLIVIYAPNGTGKTSFFDAVEWAMSGEIQRISNNQRVKEIAEQEKGHILKNKYSVQSNGTVEIKFSDKECLMLNTRALSGSRKTDYAAGKLVSTASGINLDKAKEFVGKNILTHDQVDRFLRFQGSKDRYEALRIFWDFNNDTEIYKELSSIIKEIQNQKIEFKKTQDQINLDLKKFQLNNETIDEINTLIQKYNYLSNGSEIIEIKDGSLEIILNECIIKKSEREQDLFIKSNNLKVVNNLFQIYKEDFQKNLTEFNKINNLELPNNLMKIKNLSILSEYELKKEKLIKDLYELQKKLNKINFLNQNEFTYLEKEKEKENIMNIQNEIIPKRKKNSEALLEMQYELSKRSNTVKKNNMEEDEINQKISKLNSLLNYENIKKELDTIEENQKILESKINKLNALIIKDNIKKERKLKIATMDIQELINSKDIINKFSEEKISFYDELLSYNENLINIKRNVKIKEKEIESYKKMGDEIGQLRKIGLDILNKSHSISCPLCNQEYESFNKLLNNIENINSEFHEINKHNEEFIDLKEKKKRIEELIEVSYKNFKEQLKKEISHTAENINMIKTNKAFVEEDYKKNVIEKESKYKEFEQLKVLIHEFNLEDSKQCYMLDKVNNLKNLFTHKIEKMRNENEWNKEKIEILEIRINDLSHRINKINDEITQNEITINQLNNDPIYKKYIGIKMGINNNEIDYVKNMSAQLRNEKKKIQAQMDEINNKISYLKLQLGNEIKSDILSENEKLKEKISKLEFFIYSTQKEFMNNFEKENVEEKDFIEKLRQLSEETESLKHMNNLLSRLINILSGYVNNTIKTDKEFELKIIKTEMRNLNKQLKNIIGLKEKSREYIKNRIETVFNLNSVNNIFQMIDPHPELMEIYFKLDDTLKDGGLGLNIMCKGNLEDSKGEAPILYLSSAQINILSLSIFLASAIENTSEFNTILMDDPVQHLDGLNILSFIDLIRIICFILDKQVIISTHDQGFFNLCQRKIDADYFSAKYFDLSPNIKDLSLKS